MTATLPEKARLLKAMAFPFEEAARKDSAVHVSLSSDSLFKHPGAGRLRRRMQSDIRRKLRPAHPTRRREHGHA
jgi:hypothetical protein